MIAEPIEYNVPKYEHHRQVGAIGPEAGDVAHGYTLCAEMKIVYDQEGDV